MLLYQGQILSEDKMNDVLDGLWDSCLGVFVDSDLELSYLFKNCWVKPLPKKNLLKALKGKKGYLQTVGLICGENEREKLTELLVKTGVTYITSPANMSKMLPGGTHDGEYPLRRYSKVVEIG